MYIQIGYGSVIKDCIVQGGQVGDSSRVGNLRKGPYFVRKKPRL